MTEETFVVLTVDDEVEIRDFLEEYLTEQGCTVHMAQNGAEMRGVLADHHVDVVLLDIRMPGEDGLSLVRFLRQHHQVGIIMLTAAGETVDRIVGLEMGADDYMAKPFDPRELWARIKSVARRTSTPTAPPSSTAPSSPTPETLSSPAPLSSTSNTPNTRVRVGCCWLDLQTQRLFSLDGDALPLTKMEFDLLQTFIAHPNRVLSRDQLLDLAHDRAWEPFDRSIDVRVTRLRRKIESDPSSPQTIQTVRGAGYMFVPFHDLSRG